MKKIQYILFAMVYLATLAACGGEEEFANSHTPTLHVTVGDFSGFSDGLSRAIGTSDPGKTAWTAGDELLVKVTFYHDTAKTSAVQTTTTLLTYYDNRWTFDGCRGMAFRDRGCHAHRLLCARLYSIS